MASDEWDPFPCTKWLVLCLMAMIVLVIVGLNCEAYMELGIILLAICILSMTIIIMTRTVRKWGMDNGQGKGERSPRREDGACGSQKGEEAPGQGHEGSEDGNQAR